MRWKGVINVIEEVDAPCGEAIVTLEIQQRDATTVCVGGRGLFKKERRWKEGWKVRHVCEESRIDPR